MASVEGKDPMAKIQREIYLLGQPSLHEYLDFVSEMVVDGAQQDRAALTDEWRVANDHYHALEQQEPGIADTIEYGELDPVLRPLAKEVVADPRYGRTFDALPSRFAMVELDKLVVCQKSVTVDFVEAQAMRLGERPTLDELFRFCFPLHLPEVPVEVQRIGSRRVALRCASTDFRFHESVLLRPEQIVDYKRAGAIAQVVGLVVGFGSNFLNVVQVRNRLLLQNGYHRACALRSLGITHAPCIIQTVTRHDELALTAKEDVVKNPEFYFQTARPPLLRDFFDPRIGKRLPIHRRDRVIEVTFEIKDFSVAV